MYTSAYVACVLWLFSLVLSLTAALYATLFQQWSRRYLELTQRRVAPHRRARIRGYMFGGISKFKMSLAVKIMPVLLHLSIFFFIAGLVVFVMGIGLIAGGCVLAFASVFAFGYIALTVLPYLYLNSPYSTPFSEFPWRKFQRLLLAAFSLIRGLSLSIRHLLSGWRPINQHTEELSRWSWEEAVEMRIKTHQKWLKHGLQKSIMDGATDAASNMDKVALSWTLTVLDDDREFEDFVARVPGFFDSDSISHAPSVILPLMDVQSPQSDQLDPILGSRINDLLQTCIPGTSLLTEPLRINRLRVCMRTLWYCAREYNQPRNTTPLPYYVFANFADPDMTRRIQSEEDLAARLIGRSFSSLIVRRLTQDIGTRTDQGGARAKEEELSCLAAILGKTNTEVATMLGLPGAVISFANVVSLTSSEMNTLDTARVPSEVMDIFIKTLDIVLADAPPNAELPPDLVAVFHETTPLGQRLGVPDLRADRLRQMLEVSPVAYDDPEPEVTTVAMPEPELGLGARTNGSYISLQRDPDSGGSGVRDSLLANAA